MRRLFTECVRVFRASNATVLLAYIPAKIITSFIHFFFAKIGIFCKSIAGALSEAKTHWMVSWLQPIELC